MTRMRIDSVDLPEADIFETLLDHFPDMIHSVDDSGVIVYTNRTAESLLGFTHEELLGMNIRDLYAEEMLPALEKGFDHLKQQGDVRVESLLKARDGTKIPVEIRSFSIYDDDGNFVRTFSILRDLREIKKLQDDLVHAGRLAAIGELASGVAHDINNPLTIIMMSIEMVLRHLDLVEAAEDGPVAQARTQARHVRRASDSIRKLANHLRNFSRGTEEQREAVDLYESLADALFIAQARVMKAAAEVRNTIARGRHFVLACPNQLEQVFVNLISNACDAMQDRETRLLSLCVREEVYDGLPCWCVEVSDTGVGIPAAHLEDVFQSFFTTKEKGRGTGLGLSISRGIVREHGGVLRVASEVDRGTTFTVVLPRHATPPAGAD